jgi:hypothetical protein
MAQQTAVEWLASEINSRGPKGNNPPQWLQELYDKAKEMEKQQMIKFANDYIDDDDIRDLTAEEYYNENYGNKTKN